MELYKLCKTSFDNYGIFHVKIVVKYDIRGIILEETVKQNISIINCRSVCDTGMLYCQSVLAIGLI